MTRGVLGGEEHRKKIYAAIPVGRVGKPEEIAAPILFLCTEYAWLHHRRGLQREWRGGAGGIGHIEKRI